jgi:hypothetical protein
MRVTLLLGVVAGLLASAAPGWAQTYPLRTNIVLPRVDVRSGPSNEFYVTGELRQGETVTVVREVKGQPGWLEIRPPSGSFTWINAKRVKQVDAYEAIVEGENTGVPVEALVGSAINQAKPTVQTKPGYLPGSIVYIVARPLSVDGETWLPIQPDPREVRYIPANAINAPPSASVSPSNSWAIGPKAGGSPTTPIPGYPTDSKPTPGNSTSFSPSPSPAPSITPSNPTPAAPQTYAPQWSTYGTLQTTTFTRDGQPMYVLLNPQGQTLMYATSKQGTSLKGYVGRTVSLYGPLVYRPDEFVKTPYMVASHVAMP